MGTVTLAARAVQSARPAVARFGREFTVAAVLGALVLYLAVAHREFVHPYNVTHNLLTNAAYVSIVAAGMTLVIVAGQIDLSVGSMLAVCALAAGHLARSGVPMPAVFFMSLALGLLLGALNGFLVAYLRIPSIVVTLAMMVALRGAALWWTKGYWVQQLPAAWKFLGTTSWLGLPLPVWASWAVLLAVSWVASHTAFGRHIYALGSNPQAALLAGIDTRRLNFWVFALNGLLVGLATMFHVTRFSIVQTNEGMDLELLVITAVVLGGTNIFGGSGSVIGSYLGVLLLVFTSGALVFLGVPPTWDQAVRGTFILVAVGADILRARRTRAAGPTREV